MSTFTRWEIGLLIIGLAVVLTMAQNIIVPAGIRDLAQAIAVAEGFGVANALPTLRNNPGDLSPDGYVATYATPQDGWNALYDQLARIADGRGDIYGYRADMSFAQLAAVWTATEQTAWASNVVNALRSSGYDVSVNSSIAQVLA